jgi:hypothetical protein
LLLVVVEQEVMVEPLVEEREPVAIVSLILILLQVVYQSQLLLTLLQLEVEELVLLRLIKEGTMVTLLFFLL